MTENADLRERLIAMRDRLKFVDPDRLLDREYAALENDRDTLAEAVNELARLQEGSQNDWEALYLASEQAREEAEAGWAACRDLLKATQADSAEIFARAEAAEATLSRVEQLRDELRVRGRHAYWDVDAGIREGREANGRIDAFREAVDRLDRILSEQDGGGEGD